MNRSSWSLKSKQMPSTKTAPAPPSSQNLHLNFPDQSSTVDNSQAQIVPTNSQSHDMHGFTPLPASNNFLRKDPDSDQISIRKAQSAVNDGHIAAHSASKRAMKRGLGWSWNNTAPDICLYHDAATHRKINWLFNWQLWKPDGLPHGIDFVPLVRTAKYAHELDRELTRLGPDVTCLLGFKDPDGVSEGGMMDVKDAVAVWRQYVLPAKLKFGLRLGSPGMSSDPEGQVWLAYFLSLFGGADAAGVDFVVVHWFGTDVYELKSFLADTYEKFGKPVWLTEFAYSYRGGAAGGGNGGKRQPSMDEVEDFMREAIPFLDRCAYVERYAYFGAMQFVEWAGEDGHGVGVEAEDEGVELTAAGKLYATAL